MALSIRSLKVENLARELSRRTGETMTEAIGEALCARLESTGAGSQLLKEELDSIAAECAAAPDIDNRSIEEIIGYDESGGFKHGDR